MKSCRNCIRAVRCEVTKGINDVILTDPLMPLDGLKIRLNELWSNIEDICPRYEYASKDQMEGID